LGFWRSFAKPKLDDRCVAEPERPGDISERFALFNPGERLASAFSAKYALVVMGRGTPRGPKFARQASSVYPLLNAVRKSNYLGHSMEGSRPRPIVFSLLLSSTVSACGVGPQEQPVPDIHPNAEEALGAVRPVIDCEWKAANRYDDGQSSVSQVADQILGVCIVERMKARRIFHLPVNDAELDLEDFTTALKTVEDVRKSNTHTNQN
jgi:hypothetical protein